MRRSVLLVIVSGAAVLACGEEGDMDPIPRIRQIHPTVEGPIDKGAIRLVVRGHIPEVRECYNRLLEDEPGAEGTVVLQWVIGADGEVTAAVIVDSSLPDESTAECIRRAVKNGTCPAPREGGNTMVTYPLLFTSG